MPNARFDRLRTATASVAIVQQWRDKLEAALRAAVGSSADRVELPVLGDAGDALADRFHGAVLRLHFLADPSLRLLFGRWVARRSLALGVHRGHAIGGRAAALLGSAGVVELLHRSAPSFARQLSSAQSAPASALDLVVVALVQERWPGPSAFEEHREAIAAAISLVLEGRWPESPLPDHPALAALFVHPWFRGARRRAAREAARTITSGGMFDWRAATTWEHERSVPVGLAAMAIEFHRLLPAQGLDAEVLADLKARVDHLVEKCADRAMQYWWDEPAKGLSLDYRQPLQHSATTTPTRELPVRHALPAR